MASFSRRSQSAVPQMNGSNAPSIGTSRNANTLAPSDPLQPLRAMADRVGKEVEKFAERVDHWHTHGNEDAKAKYHTTVKMVGKFRDLAETAVKELKRQNDAENKGALNRSVQRRIEKMAAEPVLHEDQPAQSSQSVVPSIETSAPSDSPSLRELRQWQAELATWELLRIIIDHYHHEPGLDVAAETRKRLQKVGGAMRFCSKSEIWDRFILEDDEAREKKLILKWLQQTARNSETDIESITQKLEELSGKDTNTWTNGWLDTRAKIKQVKRSQGLDRPLAQDTAIQNSDRTEALITQLDPDAPIRQRRSLEQSDEYYERALWMVCYEMMRRGEPWEKIADWCKERNEAWRGISIGAACASHPDGGPNVSGSDVGYLFRRMSFYAARGARSSHEGAVYGLLSGDLKQVEAVCRSWDDHLYAHYNALLLCRFDRYLLSGPDPRVPENTSGRFLFQDAVANIPDWETSNSYVIERLKRDKATASLSAAPMKLIQGALISGDVDELMYKVGIAIADMLQGDNRLQNLIVDPDSDENAPRPRPVTEQRAVNAERCHRSLASDAHALRILVHVFITLRNGLDLFSDEIDTFARQVAVDNVLTAYIEFLRVTKRLQLIPLYASQLDQPRQTHCLARILPDIKNTEEQKRSISLMEQYRVDAVDAVSQNFGLAMGASGLMVGEDKPRVPNPISRYTILESGDEQHGAYLWPGHRVKRGLSGLNINEKEEALIESLQWYNHLEREDHNTFHHLTATLEAFLLNGRIGAAEKLVAEMSIENLSAMKTTAYCGYAFDFTQSGAEEQDQDQVSEGLRKSLSASGRGSLRPSEIPSAQEHARHVTRLRNLSQEYHDLSLIVRLITLFRQWRDEEEDIIQQHLTQTKVNTKHIKELLDTIESTITPLFEPSYDPRLSDSLWLLFKAYYPEIILAYLSVLQAGAFFVHRDTATKAMDIATMIADDGKMWMQKVFLETGRMKELVDALGRVSKAMLNLGQAGDGKKASTKKRGSKGETLRIWDINVRN